MSFATKYAKRKIFEVNFEEGVKYKYLKLAEIEEGKVYPVKGVYINTKGKYDDAPYVFTGEVNINLPAYALEEALTIRATKEDIDDINAGKVGIKARPYIKDGKSYVGFEWVDM